MSRPTRGTQPARRRERPLGRKPLDDFEILAQSESTLLDLVDHLLNKGVVITGDIILGVAGVDLVFIRVSALIAAADRVLGKEAADALREPEPGGVPDPRRDRMRDES